MREWRPSMEATALPALQVALRAELARAGGVAWAYLFGSAARAEPFRDLDVAVMVADRREHTGTWLGRLAMRLQAKVGDIPVEVVDLLPASVPLRARVIAEGRLLCDHAREDRLVWEIDTARRWLDFAPWIARHERLRMLALRDGAR